MFAICVKTPKHLHFYALDESQGKGSFFFY